VTLVGLLIINCIFNSKFQFNLFQFKILIQNNQSQKTTEIQVHKAKEPLPWPMCSPHSDSRKPATWPPGSLSPRRMKSGWYVPMHSSVSRSPEGNGGASKYSHSHRNDQMVPGLGPGGHGKWRGDTVKRCIFLVWFGVPVAWRIEEVSGEMAAGGGSNSHETYILGYIVTL